METPDPEWTANAERLLVSMIASADLEADTLRSVACSTTVCKLELQFPDLASAGRLRQLVFQDDSNFDAFEVDGDGQILDDDDTPAADLAVNVPSEPDLQASAAPRGYVVYAARPDRRLDHGYADLGTGSRPSE